MTIKASKATPVKGIAYIISHKKSAIVSSLYLNDNRNYAEQFKETATSFGKGAGFGERKYYHAKLSPDPTDNATPEQCHAYAEEFARQVFPDHECIIATHNDSGVVHSHIIINSVNFENGKKFQMNNRDYGKAKDFADELGLEFGLSPMKWREKVKDKFKNEAKIQNNHDTKPNSEMNIAKRGNLSEDSWKQALRDAIDYAKGITTSRAEFASVLAEMGITMPRNTEKTVSFTHPAVGKPVRGRTLGASYTAEAIDASIEFNNKSNTERALINELSINTTITTTATTPAVTTNPRTTSANLATPPNPTKPRESGASPRKPIAPRSLGDIDRAVENVARRVYGKGDEILSSSSGEPFGNAGASQYPASTVRGVCQNQSKPEPAVRSKPKRSSWDYER